MLVDYCDGGSLSRLILDLDDPFRWRQRCSLALDLAKGMEYVHGLGYLHRDLTSMVSRLIYLELYWQPTIIKNIIFLLLDSRCLHQNEAIQSRKNIS